MRRARQESSETPAIPSPEQATPTVAHAGQSGSLSEDVVPTHATVYPRERKRPGPKPNPKIYLRGPDTIGKARPPRSEPTLRYEIPSVAKHIARVVVMYHMDYVKAVRYLVGDADDVSISKLADRIEANKQVQKYIQDELTITGLDDKSKESFVTEMWEWLRRGSENKAMKAAGILGKGFIAEKVEAVKPEQLPIEGLGDAVRSMLGETVPTSPTSRDVQAKHEPTDDIQIAEQSAGDARGPVLDPACPPAPADK